MAVTFEEAREYWEAQTRDRDAALMKSASEARVAVREIAELNRRHEAYAARLGDQADPYRAFEHHQSSLLSKALKQYATPEGRQAYAEFLYNQANPAPVDGGA